MVRMCLVAMPLALLLAGHTMAVPVSSLGGHRENSLFKEGAQTGGNTSHVEHRLGAEPFKWHMCGNPDDPFQITAASVTPWPVKFSGTQQLPLTLAIKGNITKTITGGKMALEVKKKLPYVEVWEKIPCVDGYGSCTSDLCNSLKHIFVGDCDPWFKNNGISCHCPMGPAVVSAAPSTLLLPAVGGIPTWLADGDFQVQLTFTDHDGGPIGCLWLQLSFFEAK